MQLVKRVYETTALFPSDEKFALTSQIQRATVSIPSNIAEGSSRTSINDFLRFLEISLGSAFEVETQIEIAKNLDYLSKEQYERLIDELHHIQKQISLFSRRIRESKD